MRRSPRLDGIPGFNIDRVAAAAGDDPELLRLENLDRGFEALLYDGHGPLHPAALPGMRERTVIVKAPSMSSA
jgi:hypothetical protein